MRWAWSRQARVALGRDAQLRGDGAERAHDEQLARVRLEVAHPGDEVAAGGGERRGDAQRDRAASCAATASSVPNSRSSSAAPSTASTSPTVIVVPE